MSTKPDSPLAAIKVGIANGRLVIADQAAEETRVYEGLDLSLGKGHDGTNVQSLGQWPQWRVDGFGQCVGRAARDAPPRCRGAKYLSRRDSARHRSAQDRRRFRYADLGQIQHVACPRRRLDGNRRRRRPWLRLRALRRSQRRTEDDRFRRQLFPLGSCQSHDRRRPNTIARRRHRFFAQRRDHSAGPGRQVLAVKLANPSPEIYGAERPGEDADHARSLQCRPSRQSRAKDAEHRSIQLCWDRMQLRDGWDRRLGQRPACSSRRLIGADANDDGHSALAGLCGRAGAELVPGALEGRHHQSGIAAHRFRCRDDQGDAASACAARQKSRDRFLGIERRRRISARCAARAKHRRHDPYHRANVHIHSPNKARSTPDRAVRSH